MKWASSMNGHPPQSSYTPTVQLFGHASGSEAQTLASLSLLQSEEPEALLTRLRSGAITLSARISSGTATQLCTLRMMRTAVDGHVGSVGDVEDLE